MSWLFISILSNTILAFSAVFDKLLLGRSIRDPFVYAFWTAISSLAVVVLIPFGSISVLWNIFWLSLATGAIWFLGALFFLIAIARGEASTALPLIGALAPIATFFTSAAFLNNDLGVTEYLGFSLLVLGGLVFLIAEDPKLRISVFVAAGLSAIFFGISNALLNPVFLHSSFVAGIFWTRIGVVIAALSLLFSKKVRERLFAAARTGNIRDWTMYWGNRVLAAGGVILNFYPFALAHPALVDAANGFKYAVIVFLGWIILGERFRGKVLLLKILATALIIGGLLWFGLGEYASSIPVDEDREIKWGITFSHKFSRDLGLDWKENFNAILYEVEPRKMRLAAYWDEIERERGMYDFSDFDWMMGRARESGVEIILAVGLRVPRWPECHIPPWAKIQNSKFKNQNELEEYIKRVVERYKENPAVKMWQVENEPYLRFGECPAREQGFLEREIALVKSIDSARPILITDGGEFGDWYRSAKAGDVFGTTMYRRAYPRFIGPIFGVIEYPLSSAYFKFKEKLVRWFASDYDKKFIVIELQGEPWSSIHLHEVPLKEQFRIFDLDYFRDTVRYAREAGFDEYYLWGAEWWYWLGKKHNDWRFWDEAKNLMGN